MEGSCRCGTGQGVEGHGGITVEGAGGASAGQALGWAKGAGQYGEGRGCS